MRKKRMQKNNEKSHDEIAKLMDETDLQKQPKDKEDEPKNVMISGLSEIKENIKFVDKTQNEPIKSDKHDLKKEKKGFFKEKKNEKGEVIKEKVYVTILNFNHYIQQQAWPSSIYFIDKLLRLNTSASLEWQKRYLKKKRPVNKEFLWLIIIIVIVILAVVILWMFLSKGGV
jgi:hypothetical protein